MRSVALAAVIAFGAAAPLRAQSAAEHAAMGAAAREARDPATALKHFQAALAIDSMNDAANWQAALSLIDLGKLTPDDAKSPARDSMYAQAEVYARRAVTANPNDADGHFALANAVGRASLTKGKRERVQRAAEIRDEALRAIQLNPRQDGAYHVLGRWNAEIMRLSGMTKFFARNFLGGAVFDLASWESATSNMEKAVELNPQRIYHRLDLAEIYIDRGRYSDARTQLSRIASLPLLDAGDQQYKAEAVELLKKVGTRKNDS